MKPHGIRTWATGIAVAGLVFAVAATAHALPFQLTQAQFAAEIASLPTIVEDFQTVTLTPSNPFVR